jgi:hypothetical protein
VWRRHLDQGEEGGVGGRGTVSPSGRRDERAAVPLLEGEEEAADEEEDEERQHLRVLEALVCEWIMQEMDTILATNRFHMKVQREHEIQGLGCRVWGLGFRERWEHGILRLEQGLSPACVGLLVQIPKPASRNWGLCALC